MVVRIMKMRAAALLLLRRAGVLAGVAACAHLTPGTLAFLSPAR